MMSAMRIELFFDAEAQNWHFRVPALHIVGGGVQSRAEAARACLDAVEFALQGDPRDFDAASDVVTFQVTVEPVA